MHRFGGLAIALAAVSLTVLPNPCQAQSPGPTTYGSYSSSYTAPSWGQASPGAWGTYSGNLGQNGWQYNRVPQANEPTSGVYPNAGQGTGGAGAFTLPRRGRNTR